MERDELLLANRVELYAIVSFFKYLFSLSYLEKLLLGLVEKEKYLHNMK
jgi:hypothetical protein